MTLIKAHVVRSAAAFVVVAQFVLCLLLVVVPLPAEAKSPRPFKGRVVATWDNVFAALPPAFGGASLAKFNGTSQMTHMGNAAQTGTLTLTPTDPSKPLFPGNGSVTITAANGDTVKFDYRGILNAGNGEGRGRFNITGGTGRFSGATGQGTFDAVIDIFRPTSQPMTVILDGWINY